MYSNQLALFVRWTIPILMFSYIYLYEYVRLWGKERHSSFCVGIFSVPLNKNPTNETHARASLFTRLAQIIPVSNDRLSPSAEYQTKSIRVTIVIIKTINSAKVSSTFVQLASPLLCVHLMWIISGTSINQSIENNSWELFPSSHAAIKCA